MPHELKSNLFLASVCNLWEEPNNNSEPYLYLKAVDSSTTIVVSVGVYGNHLYRAMLLISVFFVPAALLCGVLLVDDCNCHQFA